MACYLPDRLVRCLICKKLFSDARRLRCGCVYCYSCCLSLVKNSTLNCQCSVIHRFYSQDDLEKSLVIDNVVNDLVREHIKQEKNSRRLVDYDSTSISSQLSIDEHKNSNNREMILSSKSNKEKKILDIVKPSCTLCRKQSNNIILCEHCHTNICEICIKEHYEFVTDTLHNKWFEYKEKLNEINQYVLLSNRNKSNTITKFDSIKQIIEERTKNLKISIDNHRQMLTKHIDDHIRHLEHLIKINNVENQYKSIRERLSKILDEETNASNLLTIVEEVEEFLQFLKKRYEQLKDIEMKIPCLSQPDPVSINIANLIGELKLDNHTSTDSNKHLSVDSNQENNFDEKYAIRTRYSRSMRSSIHPQDSRGCRHLSNSRYHRFNGKPSHRGRLFSRLRSMPIGYRENDVDMFPNNNYQWSTDCKEIPYFLSILNNQNQKQNSSTSSCGKPDHMLFIANDLGRIFVYNIPKSTSKLKPSIISTGELFSRNSHLILQSFTVYEYAIIVYVRRYEQKLNEIEHSKLIKAGLPILTGDQSRYNDHGGMIYLFSHDCQKIDGIYQSSPIRVILADQSLNCLWILNPMQNNICCYSMPNSKNDIKNFFKNEEIIFNFADDLFEPSIMIQSEKSIGFIDTEHDSYRLYSKENRSNLITFQNLRNENWKLTDGVIFRDNRTLLKLIEHKPISNKPDQTKFPKNIRRCLIELTASGHEIRQIQANTVYSMTLGPDDELILGLAGRGGRGLIQCY